MKKSLKNNSEEHERGWIIFFFLGMLASKFMDIFAWYISFPLGILLLGLGFVIWDKLFEEEKK